MIRPLQGKVLVRMDRDDEVSEGGIVIPERQRDQATTGTVLRMGIWRQNAKGNLIPFPVSKGDKVVISKYRGRQVKNPELRLKLVDQDDIHAIL